MGCEKGKSPLIVDPDPPLSPLKQNKRLRPTCITLPSHPIYQLPVTRHHHCVVHASPSPMASTFYTTSLFPTFISFPSRIPSTTSTSVHRFRAKMLSTATQVESPTVLGFGGVGVDLLATVAEFPNPDDKIRSTSLKVQGGGNAGNALTCAARLGLNARLISKVADDAQGRGILEELKADGVDVSEEGNSPFTYVIVDNQTKTRTCIHTPGSPPMVPDDISNSTLLAALAGVKLVYFDVRLHDTALLFAHEICSLQFRKPIPWTWTGAPTVPSALVSMLLRLPKLKFVIVTLGADGESVQAEEIDIDDLVEKLKCQSDSSTATPSCVSSDFTILHAKGVGSVCGKLFLGTAEKIPQSELVDTTGAGDAFIGAVLYGICTNKSPEQMLPFAAQVAAIACRALGARAGLPRLTDPRLASLS
ncbi:hypothetical protein M8C21_008175 [Ambrosia artemisiifolia]|uniref:Carbohydrate kinase PfkB domain-containing protein n=1 Tax=Ambrosia artemisiifolia TaxID=4212 RepID=A0AAD5GP59_AMBAR|nr:hypothetical protein M8C21_008175 [Ambrosia artemisiifolia]